MKGLEHKKFFIPTIPYWWHTSASILPGKAHAVGSQIWFVFRTVFKGKASVKLSRQYFSLTKFDRKTVSRGLVNLEKAGLITVERGTGKAPLITINTDEQKVSELRQQWIDRKHRVSNVTAKKDRQHPSRSLPIRKDPLFDSEVLSAGSQSSPEDRAPKEAKKPPS